MPSPLSFAFVPLNSVIGDVAAQAVRMSAHVAQAAKGGADVVVFPELALCGYPPQDLLLHNGLRAKVGAGLQAVQQAAAQQGVVVLCGAPEWQGNGLYNAVYALSAQGIQVVQRKENLPNYGVFNERRYFMPSFMAQTLEVRGVKLGIIICEDGWYAEPAKRLRNAGAEVLISVNASPYETGKMALRADIIAARAAETGLPVAYVNAYGGQDELVFDGGVFAMLSEQGVCHYSHFSDEITYVSYHAGRWQGREEMPLSEHAADYAALVLGLRDYFGKVGMKKAVLGLSGGIDSAFVAALAVDALGAGNVTGIRLPSAYTSAMSMEDAAETAQLLGIELQTLPISAPVLAVEQVLAPHFADKPAGVAEENMQARMRGLLLMAWSNKFGHGLLNTTNKSEMAVGYGTLYGDMCGAWAPLKDVYKLKVYALSRWRNEHHLPMLLGKEGRAVPERSITRAPSAELREDQQDTDSLPPYEVLDTLLQGLVERRCSVAELVKEGFAREVVEKVNRLLYSAEYKRFQAPPGAKITPQVFGRDWQLPLAQHFDNE